MFADAEPAVSKGTAITTITARAIIITIMTMVTATTTGITTITMGTSTLVRAPLVSKCLA